MTRLLTVVAATGASLALASPALASFAPKLAVSSAGGSRATRIGVTVGNADDQVARIAILLPAGYHVASAAPGRLGSVTATVATLGGAVLPLTGELDAVAATPATDAIAAQCQVSASQTWSLALAAAGQALNVPLFFAAAPVPGYAAQLVACLPPQQSAPFGSKLLSATLSTAAVAQPAAMGDYRWTSTWTPYTASGTPNPGGTVQVQSLRRVPPHVSLTVTKRKVTAAVRKRVNGKMRTVRKVSTSVRFSAQATANGAAPSSTRITTTAAGKTIGGAAGSLLLAAGKSAAIVATAVIDSDTGSIPTGRPAKPSDLFFHDLGAGGCVAVADLAFPCTDAAVGGETVKAATTVRGFR